MTETLSTFELVLYTHALLEKLEGAFNEADELIKRFDLEGLKPYYITPGVKTLEEEP